MVGSSLMFVEPVVSALLVRLQSSLPNVVLLWAEGNMAVSLFTQLEKFCNLFTGPGEIVCYAGVISDWCLSLSEESWEISACDCPCVSIECVPDD